MGTIQNSFNGMLGAAAGAATLGKHISNQNKELSIKKVAAEQEQYNADEALKQNTTDIAHQMILEGNDAGLEPQNGETPAEAEQRAVDEYLEAKSEAAEDKYQEQMMKVKNPATSKRVEMARKAADEAQDAINARRNLQFNLELANKRLDIFKGVK